METPLRNHQEKCLRVKRYFKYQWYTIFNGSAVFGTMPPMCRSCPDVNKLWGMDTTILGQHRPFMSIKSFVQHSGWQEMVSLCSLIRLIGVCADRDQPEFLCSRSDSRYLEVHVATAGGWLTRYRPREVRNSIYRYRGEKKSKFLYRFISLISIIYGNTNNKHIVEMANVSFHKKIRDIAKLFIYPLRPSPLHFSEFVTTKSIILCVIWYPVM